MKTNYLEKSFVGVDTHKEKIACFVNGKFKEFKTDFKGYKKALEWAGKDCIWAIEGAYSYGLSLSEFLLKSGCKVYEFNALITAKARKAISISGEKNDFGDAKVISIFAKHTKLQEVSLTTIALKQKLTTRKLLVGQRTQLINNIKSYFIKKGVKLPFKCLTTKKAVKWLINYEDICIFSLGKVMLELNNSIEILENEIISNLPEIAKELTKIVGIGVINAATIYTELKGKKMTKAQLASYFGVAPVECSSGLTTRVRANKRGNRTLNSILYFVSMHQIRFDKTGSEYYHKKLSEGKSSRHARKCLARQISNQIWKVLFAA